MSNDQMLGTLLPAALTTVSIVVAIYVYWRQCNAQVFLEYTKRYAEIMDMFPVKGRKARLDLFGRPPAVLRYLNLCSEEFYLCKRWYLSKRVWRIWEAELKRTLTSPLVMREWPGLREEFQSYPEFREYVQNAQRQTQHALDAVHIVRAEKDSLVLVK